VKMNRQAGDEDCQVKIDPGERGKTKGNSEKVQFFHGENIVTGRSLSRTSFS
jgi:hypothetical protein